MVDPPEKGRGRANLLDGAGSPSPSGRSDLKILCRSERWLSSISTVRVPRESADKHDRSEGNTRLGATVGSENTAFLARAEGFRYTHVRGGCDE
jgi:hypothetical protein